MINIQNECILIPQGWITLTVCYSYCLTGIDASHSNCNLIVSSKLCHAVGSVHYTVFSVADLILIYNLHVHIRCMYLSLFTVVN